MISIMRSGSRTSESDGRRLSRIGHWRRTAAVISIVGFLALMLAIYWGPMWVIWVTAGIALAAAVAYAAVSGVLGFLEGHEEGRSDRNRRR